MQASVQAKSMEAKSMEAKSMEAQYKARLEQEVSKALKQKSEENILPSVRPIQRRTSIYSMFHHLRFSDIQQERPNDYSSLLVPSLENHQELPPGNRLDSDNYSMMMISRPWSMPWFVGFFFSASSSSASGLLLYTVSFEIIEALVLKGLQMDMSHVYHLMFPFVSHLMSQLPSS